MDYLLNVIRAIIDMLPGRCKTINSILSLWYLSSTPLFTQHYFTASQYLSLRAWAPQRSPVHCETMIQTVELLSQYP